MSLIKDNTKILYNSSIVPAVTEGELKALREEYEKSNVLPKRLKIRGIAIDSSENQNHWQLAEEDLEEVAKALVGKNIMKNHDSDNVDSVIGIVTNAGVEEAKAGDTPLKQVWFEGEVADKGIIEKLLLGYLKFTSIQILAPEVYCANCYKNNGVDLAEAALQDIEKPCPRCGEYALYIRHPVPVEQSLVVTPAYPRASVNPIGFSAAINTLFASRFNKEKFIKEKEPNSEISETSFLGREKGGFRIPNSQKNMSTAAPAGEISKPKGLDYDKGVEGFADQLSEILKWIKMSYQLQLEESRARKRKAALDRIKLSRLRASEEVKKEEEEEEDDDEAGRKHEEEEEEARHSEEEEAKRAKREEIRKRLEEARKMLEEARAKREASAQTANPKGVVGELKGDESTKAKAVDPMGVTIPEYWSELKAFVASAKERGLLG
jgi:hypothetical protein